MTSPNEPSTALDERYLTRVGETRRVVALKLTDDVGDLLNERFRALHRKKKKFKALLKALAKLLNAKVADAEDAQDRLDAILRHGEREELADCLVAVDSRGGGVLKVLLAEQPHTELFSRPLTGPEREQWGGLFKDPTAMRGVPEMRASAPPDDALAA